MNEANKIDLIKQAEIEILNGETLTIACKVQEFENDLRHLIRNAKNINLKFDKFEMEKHIANLAEYNDFTSVRVHYQTVTPNHDGDTMWVYEVHMKDKRGEEIHLFVYVLAF